MAGRGPGRAPRPGGGRAFAPDPSRGARGPACGQGTRWRLAVGLGLLLAGLAEAAAAQGPGDAERQRAAMVQTVLEQLAAFRRGDWETAYGFASAAIRGRFAPHGFREMVTRGYAEIARSRHAFVLGTEIVDAQHGFVEVRVFGENRRTVDALYELVEEQGAWKINGVVTKPAERGETVRARRPPTSAA